MANRSRCILQKELREQIAPVALLERSDERANRSFTKEQWERMSSLRVTGAILYERVIRFFKEWFASNPIFSLFYAQTKRANHSRLSFKNSDECESLLLLFTERSKRANHSVTLYKKSHKSDSLRRSLQKEPRERFALWKERITLSLSKNARFSWKTKERFPNPAPEW